MIADQIEPVAAVRNIADYTPVSLNLYRDVLCKAIAWHIRNSHHAILIQLGLDRADRGFDLVDARVNSAQVFQSFDQPDHAVAAHAKISDVIEKYNSGRRSFGGWFAQQCPDDGI